MDEPVPTAHDQPSRRVPLIPLDAGWLFLLPGIALVAATVLIPAFDDLGAAQLERDKLRVVENHAQRRLENYSLYLDALRRADEDLTLSLAATHLNLAPVDRTVIVMPDQARASLNPYPALEPPSPRMPTRVTPDTVLQRWATHERARLWLLASGAMCILLGLLPPTARRRERAPRGEFSPAQR